MDSSHENRKRTCPKHEEILVQRHDWLSNLPCDILYHILSFLDTTEVVKTSLLSTKWRYFWTSAPYLNFDFRGFWKQEHCLVLSHDACLSKFWEFVKWALIFRDRSPIYKLQLFCDYYGDEQLWLLIYLCAVRNVQELNLLDGYEYQHCPFLGDPSEPILGMGQNTNGLVNLQSSRAFGNLKTLRLVKVQFHHPAITEKLFSDCGMLENLSMEYCCFLKVNVLYISARRLIRLNFVNMDPFRCMGSNIFDGRLKVHTPNLVSFCYIGPQMQPCEFSSNMPFLNHAFIQFPAIIFEREQCLKLEVMVSKIRCARELSLSEVFVMYFAHGRPCCKFNYVKRLKLNLACNDFDMEGLINLLKHCPSLEVLCFKLNFPSHYHGPTKSFWKSRKEDVPCLSNHLKEIEISEFHDATYPFELVKFFLQNGKSVEKMKIMQNKENMMNPKKLHALQEVEIASEAISISISSFSASGKTKLLQFASEKCGGSAGEQTNKLKIKSERRSMRIAARKSVFSN